MTTPVRYESIGGVRMLVLQVAFTVELLTGCPAPVEIMQAAVEAAHDVRPQILPPTGLCVLLVVPGGLLLNLVVALAARCLRAGFAVARVAGRVPGYAGRLSSAAWVRCPAVMALNRLCTAAARVHSADALAWPRTDSWRKRMLCLMWPCGVSAMWPRWR